MELKDKRVIVTGGASGLGRAMVDELVSRGAAVTVFDLDAQGLSKLKKAHATVHCVECDVSDPNQVSTATAAYHEDHKSADVLINNAGILYSAPLIRLSNSGVELHDVPMWNKVLENDLSSVFYMTRKIVEKMIVARTKGVIVNISSVSAAGNPGASAYAAAKAGVNALTAAWAKELGPLGIRVVAIAPGFTETESARAVMSSAALRETINRVPLRRLGRPEEIAEGVTTIIRNDFFNGKVFELDGGLVL